MARVTLVLLINDQPVEYGSNFDTTDAGLLQDNPVLRPMVERLRKRQESRVLAVELEYLRSAAEGPRDGLTDVAETMWRVSGVLGRTLCPARCVTTKERCEHGFANLETRLRAAAEERD